MVGRAMTGKASACLAQVGFRTGAAITGCSTIDLRAAVGSSVVLIGLISFNEHPCGPRAAAVKKQKKMLLAMVA